MGAPEIRWWGARAAALGCFTGAALRALSFFPYRGERYEQQSPVLAALLAALAAVALFLAPSRPTAVLAALAGTAACLLKPTVLPVLHDTGAFTLTSETHLYYLVPGILLGFLAFGLALAPPPTARVGRDGGANAGVLAVCVVASGLMLVDFFASRGAPFDVAASFAPGALMALLAVVVLVRGELLQKPVPVPQTYAAVPHAMVLPPFPSTLPQGSLERPGKSYGGDASFDQLIRALAQAPAPFNHTGAPAPPEALVGGRFGPFVILELLGAGGMGRVYRTRDERLLRDVAVKVVAPGGGHERRERMLREARAAARVNHPNVAAIYDIGVDGDVPYIVMELCPGRPLRALLAGGPLEAERARSIARQIAEGLAAAHAHGIVHRDLKPENVMVADDGRVKVLDFGLARLEPGSELIADASDPSHTRAGAVLGTPGYMSPEQARGAALDVRSDVFSFGVVLAEMLAGRSPFLRASFAETRAAILAAELPPGLFDGRDGPLGAIAKHCLAAEPAARYADAGELAAALAGQAR